MDNIPIYQKQLTILDWNSMQTQHFYLKFRAVNIIYFNPICLIFFKG